jgi:hypothetical protein
MSYSLFLDDERVPPYKSKRKWIVCRTVEEAIKTITQYGLPEFITFDHDLGHGKRTGMDLAKWLVEYDMDHDIIRKDNFDFDVHSMNPIGAGNIKGLLSQYLKRKFYNT